MATASPEPQSPTIEDRKLALEEKKVSSDARFLIRHGGALIGAFVSVVAIVVSAYQNHASESNRAADAQRNYEQSSTAEANRAAASQRDFEQKKLELNESELEWKRQVAEMFVTHDAEIFSSDQDKRNRFINIFVATMPDDITKVIVPELSASLVRGAEDLSTLLTTVNDTKLTAGDKQAVTQAVINATASTGTGALPTIYVEYQGQADAAYVEGIVTMLRLKGYKVPGKQLVTQATEGDIRYYKTDERSKAKDLLDAVASKLLSETGLKLSDASLKDLSKTFPNLPSGILELWLPRLPKRPAAD